MSKPSKQPASSLESSSSSKLLRVTLEGAVMSAVSNTLAQALNVYKGGFAAIDRVAFVHFIILAIITTPPNYKWQLWLEETFPSHPARVGSATTGKKQDEKASLSIPNTIAKFALDQSLGASFNTLWFIVMINLLRGESFSHIVTIAQTDFFPMLMAGYKFWPIVTILNLAIVPFDQRMMVGGLAGLIWGMYLSLTQM